LEIDSWHKNRADPFIGIGYHYLIHWDGSIEQGRPALENVQGAHAYGINSRSIGICLTGRYHQNNTMPEAQFNSGVKLTAWILENKYPNCTIIKHRDSNLYSGEPSGTVCPGDYFVFDSMKNKVLDMLKGAEIISNFIDVVAGYWAEEDINYLQQHKIIVGEDTPQGKILRPNEFATRAEVIALIARSLRLLNVQ
jgi:N-acetyl-anhydromuramyl-L-alanine amidase AmpD